MARKPEYQLKTEMRCKTQAGGDATLPTGASITPMYFGYLPLHVQKSDEGRRMNPAKEQYCYTRFGLVLIPLELIMEVTWA